MMAASWASWFLLIFYSTEGIWSESGMVFLRESGKLSSLVVACGRQDAGDGKRCNFGGLISWHKACI